VVELRVLGRPLDGSGIILCVLTLAFFLVFAMRRETNLFDEIPTNRLVPRYFWGFHTTRGEFAEEASCHQYFGYSGAIPPTSADLAFGYAVDKWGSPAPVAVLKVHLTFLNGTMTDLWVHSVTGLEGWTWVGVDLTDCLGQRGLYRLPSYVHLESQGSSKQMSFRWDNMGIGASFLYIKLGALEDGSVIYTCLIKLILDYCAKNWLVAPNAI